MRPWSNDVKAEPPQSLIVGQCKPAYSVQLQSKGAAHDIESRTSLNLCHACRCQLRLLAVTLARCAHSWTMKTNPILPSGSTYL